MDRSLRLRTIVLVLGVLFSVATLLPTVFSGDELPPWFRSLFSTRIALGTDIAGGARFVYSIDLDKAVDDKASEIKRDLESKLGEDSIKGVVKTPAVPVGAVTVIIEDAAKRDQISKLIQTDYGDTVVTRPCSATDPGGAICVRVSSDYADGIKKAALTNAVNTIRERIDEKGIAEPSVIEKGDEVIVELPGLDDDAIARIKDIIARTAKLEFKLVDNGAKWMADLFAKVDRGDPLAKELGISATPDSWIPEQGGRQSDYYLFASDREEAVSIEEAKKIGCWTRERELEEGQGGKLRCNVSGRRIIDRYLTAIGKEDPKWQVPDDRQIGYEYIPLVGDSETHTKPYYRTYYLDRAVQLAGSAISNAATSYDPQTGHPLVLVDFNRYGGRVWGDLTSANVGKKIATILDDNVKSAPIINGPIRGGRCSITMGGSNVTVQEKEAVDLVAVLKTGSLPAPLMEESTSRVGPTLGRDAVDRAKLSFGLGILLVIIIMVGIYKWSGWISVAAVVFHIIMTLAVMALFGATLTLPGIAAIVLSIGMEVDGNILIYERIRDELNTGKSVRGAVDLGFSRAFSAILDGQLTTAAAGWVLLQYGSGPIKGFAVMLLVGVFTTLTTNVWVTRIFFDWYINRKTKKQGQMATISIEAVMSEHPHKFRYLLPPGSNFQFMAKAKIFMILAVVVFFGTIGALAYNKTQRGEYMNWTIDFRGGTEIVYAFKSKADPTSHLRVDAHAVRQALKKSGEEGFDVSDMSWTDPKTDKKVEGLMIRTPRFSAITKQQADEAAKAFEAAFTDKGIEKAAWSGERLYVRSKQSMVGLDAAPVFAAHNMVLKPWDVEEQHLYEVPDQGTGEYHAVFAIRGIDHQIETVLESALPESDAVVIQSYGVGAKAGAELRNDAFKAVIYALFLIVLYLAFRFDLRYAPGAAFATIHDAIAVILVFAVTWTEVSLTTVAALLTVIGYSVNDTVIIFDRIRENQAKLKDKKLERIIDISLNETLVRSILTSATVFATTLIMNIFGDGLVRNFAFAMNIGVIVGTYSSIFLASPIFLWMSRRFYSGPPRQRVYKTAPVQAEE